ncbi:MAG: transporter substrate-binding domain-containing protein [Gammaproteobacteria bacterium]|nr:transporter substrate-binding domain-containing protein [Gammaproteobacteria bacterium]
MLRCSPLYKISHFSRQPAPISVLFFICIIIATSTHLHARPVITLSTADTTGGFFHTPKNNGFADEVLIEAYSRLNHDIVIITLPTERSLIMSNSGQTDGELLRTTSIEPKYKNLIRIPEPIVNVKFIAYSHLPFDTNKGWDSLIGRSIGIVIGMKIIENNIPSQARVSRVKNARLLFDMLKKKRIDIAILPDSIGDEFITQNQPNNILSNTPALSLSAVYTYLHTKHAHLAPKLSESLTEMKNDGTFSRIVKNHTSYHESQ